MDDEISAINFLLEDIPDRMKTLAQDIAEKGFVYDPPLIRKETNGWRVYDGNRRVACVKLMHNPSIANNQSMQKFFEKLAATYQGKIPLTANCRIENNLKIINDILERRHAGGDSGIGQMPWKPDEKENFLIRAGIPHKPRFGTELSRTLKEKGIIGKNDRIKVSIFDRLLNSEANKNRVGITFKGNKLAFIADEKRALEVIDRIMKDVAAGDINLNKTWSKTEKDAYFSHLENQGYLPLIANDAKKNAASQKIEITSDKGIYEQDKLQKEKQYVRPHLIPEGVRFSFDDAAKTARIKNVIIELQSDLFFSKHLNAIAVLFRVLIEMCVDHYIEAKEIKVSTKNNRGPSLAEKFDACLNLMVDRGYIADKDRKVLVKFKQPEQFLSADTFHSYIHHRLAHPMQSDLIAMWDQLQPFITQCLTTSDKSKNIAA